ncbi:AAA family ATPase [Rummeliibacillus pycnus]|uniref:AAA family ATPase n=1 Tax=Rummeliibacillus pycnus TaxID=101070 RepID=UPI003D2AE0FE
MIKSCLYINLFNQEKEILLETNDVLTILTGDNGSGKTTLLNSLFNSLSGNFEDLFNLRFERIEIEFLKNEKNLNKIVVNKYKNKNKNTDTNKIEVEYHFFKDELISCKLLKKNNTWSTGNEYIYLLGRSADKEETRNTYEKLNDLIDENPQFEIINEIKEALLYFPTYRRIDKDIEDLLEINYFKDYIHPYKKIIETNKILSNLQNDRRVIGVGDDDIEVIFNNYSEKIREFNSEGLNGLMKKFIKNIIESIYKDSNYTNKKKVEKQSLFESAADDLIQLSDKLGIKDQLDKSEIVGYFDKKKSIQKLSDDAAGSLKVEINTEFKQKEKDSVNRKIDKIIKEFILESFKSIGNEENFIINLITLYREHLNNQEKILEPFRQLQNAFDKFFKERLILEFNERNFNISLSRNFTSLSTGEKQLVTLFSYIGLTIKKNSFKPLVIIDEPELSLHISWQHKLLSQLLEIQDNQFLIATHSPYIANIAYSNFVSQLGEIDA